MDIISTHANFSVDDIETAKQFYTDLGLTVIEETSGGLRLASSSGSQVEIYEKPDHQPWNATVFGIEVPDITTALDELKVRGIEPEAVEGTDENYIATMDDTKAFWIKDPAGNWVCFSSRQ